jgi:hypothetical protein
MVNPMKIIVFISLSLILGCILTTGCVGQIKDTTVNNSPFTPTNTFIPFSNTTNISNTSTITTTSGLKGPLRVPIGGWDAALPVSIDNKSVGIVTKDKPLDLMLEEGNHTVKVCSGKICLEEIVTVKFAKQRIVDFEERLLKEVEFPNPTVRIVGSNPAGSHIVVSVEYINPSLTDLSMSAVVKCGYSYIDSRSNSRIGGVAEGYAYATVKSGARVSQKIDLSLASGYSYIYSIPTISDITYR